MTRRPERCRQSGGHHIHYTQGDALTAAAACSRGGGASLSVYRCPFSNHWHLTSTRGDAYRWLNMKFDLRVSDLILGDAPVSDLDSAVRWLGDRWPTPAHLIADHLTDGRARAVLHWDEQRRALEWQRAGGWAAMAPKPGG